MSQALHCSTQVLSVVEFESEAEAIALANDSEFGLGGGVISQDLERCQRVAEALECGIVWVNCSQPCFIQVGVPAAVWGYRGRRAALRVVGRPPIGFPGALHYSSYAAVCFQSLGFGIWGVSSINTDVLGHAGAMGWHQEQRPWSGAGRVGARQLLEREAGHTLCQLKCMGLVPRCRRQAMMTLISKPPADSRSHRVMLNML